MKMDLSSKEKNSYIWLIIGGILLVFFNGKWVIPIASWIAPVFLIRFYRINRNIKGLFLPLIVLVVTIFFSFKGVTGTNCWIEYPVLAGLSIVFYLPFLIDRIIEPKIKGFLSTFILPFAGVTIEYALSIVSPYGTWGSLAYTQYGNLPLMQLASVTGIWGISFMLYWFYSYVNWMWLNEFNINKIKNGTAIFISVFTLIMLFGGLRTIILTPIDKTVKIASISVPHKYLNKDIHAAMKDENYSKEDKELFKQKAGILQDELLNKTKQEAENGAKIIFWDEVSTPIFKEYEDLLLNKVSSIARQYNVNILLSLCTIQQGNAYDENKSVFIDGKGEIKYTYLKSKIVLGDNDRVGDGIIKYVDTSFGRVGNAICFDADFPSYIRQAGKDNIDILLLPSSDWKEIDPIHTKMSVFRAVENGFSIIRQVQDGYSLSTDYLGNTISSMDYFNTDNKVMISYVPIEGVKTIYASIGDIFAWVCTFGFLIMLVVNIKLKNSCK